MTPKNDLSALSAPVPVSLLSAVFYDAEKGTFLRGDHVYRAFCASGASADAFCAWCAERWLQRVDTSYEHAVRLAAAVVDRIDFFELRDAYDTELHAIKDIADALFRAGQESSAVYEYIANMYGEQDDGNETEQLVQLMDEMRLFIKARVLQKKRP